MKAELLPQLAKQLRAVTTFVLFALLTQCSTSLENTLSITSEFEIEDAYFEGKAVLETLPASQGFKILLRDSLGKMLDQTIFRYRHYQFDTADVNGDGRTEILIGLIKKTTFDPEKRKRLFILRIDEGQLRPLWLGSKVCQELVNFKALEKGKVRTLERTSGGVYSIGIYEWQGFGLTLIHYTHNEKNYSDAVKIFGS